MKHTHPTTPFLSIPITPCCHSNHYLFLTWFNDWLTLERFAEYYSMTTKRAQRIINKGRAIHEAQFGSIA